MLRLIQHPKEEIIASSEKMTLRKSTGPSTPLFTLTLLILASRIQKKDKLFQVTK
jgi:hypothetical protein